MGKWFYGVSTCRYLKKERYIYGKEYSGAGVVMIKPFKDIGRIEYNLHPLEKKGQGTEKYGCVLANWK